MRGRTRYATRVRLCQVVARRRELEWDFLTASRIGTQFSAVEKRRKERLNSIAARLSRLGVYFTPSFKHEVSTIIAASAFNSVLIYQKKYLEGHLGKSQLDDGPGSPTWQ